MAKIKVEVFLEKELIELLKTVSSNRSEAIRMCVENQLSKVCESDCIDEIYGKCKTLLRVEELENQFKKEGK